MGNRSSSSSSGSGSGSNSNGSGSGNGSSRGGGGGTPNNSGSSRASSSWLYPAEHYSLSSLRGSTSRLAASESRRGSRASSSTSSSGSAGGGRGGNPSPDQTICPQCQRVLLIPPNAPLFRCPCGVLFRTEALNGGRGDAPGSSRGAAGSGALLMGSGGSSLSSLLLGTSIGAGGGGSGGQMGRAVLCRRCRRLSVVPASRSLEEVTICRCGAPALPLNDVVMSLLAEGELGLIGGGRRGGAFGGEMEGASRDLIEMLPTCQYNKAAHQQRQRGRTEEDGGLKGKGKDGGSEKEAVAAVLAAPVAVVEGGAVPVVEVKAEAVEGGKPCAAVGGAASASPCCAAAAVVAVTAAEAAEAALPVKEEGKQTEAEHGDDLSCRVCFEDYEDGDEQRVLPCFHRFHVACIDEWLARKKLCPLCNTSIDVVLSPPENHFLEQAV